MVKIIGTSVVVALLVASNSFANLIHNQGTGIGLTNVIELLHGDQSASSTQNLVVSNDQSATGVCGASAAQSLFNSLGQVGNAWGECALVGLTQDIGITGNQSQDLGDACDPKAQVQSLGLEACQALSKSDGAGGGDAVHTIVLTAGQSGTNAAGSLNESQNILGMQTSNITGHAGATGVVSSVMDVCTSQTQAAL
jgi:hypothetical protein